MSTKEIKTIFSIFIIAFSLSSCLTNREERSEKFVSLNFKGYQSTYNSIIDSINLYISSRLKEFSSEFENEWVIDSLVCINSTQDKLIGTILISHGACKDCVSDNAQQIFGKRLNNVWHFFKGGGTLIIPRDMYKKNEMNPLTFHELSQIARKEFFAGALIKKDGKYIVSDEWVNNHFEYNGMCAHCKTHEQYDSTHWKKITDKWKKRIDTAAFKRYVPKPAL